MWIEERQTKKGLQYRYAERYTDSTGKQKIVRVTLNSNSAQAQKTATRLLYEKIERAKVLAEQDNRITFAKVAQEWQEFDRLTVKVNTATNHALHLKRAIGLLPDNVRLCDITAIHVEHMANTLYYNEGLTYGYCKSVLQTVKRVFKYAKRKKLIANISEILEVELKRKPCTPDELSKKKNKFLDRDELKTCLSQLKAINEPIALMMEFISRTGLRFGELIALRVQDYDKENRRIHVNGTIVNAYSVKSTALRGTPKNVYSVRSVDLDARTTAIIDHFIMENRKRALWLKSYKDIGYIFTTNRGNPYNLQYVSRFLRKLSIGDKHISTHIFRHTHISILAELNIPLKAIMERVGHNDPATTLSIYTHVTESMQKEVVKKLDALTV